MTSLKDHLLKLLLFLLFASSLHCAGWDDLGPKKCKSHAQCQNLPQKFCSLDGFCVQVANEVSPEQRNEKAQPPKERAVQESTREVKDEPVRPDGGVTDGVVTEKKPPEPSGPELPISCKGKISKACQCKLIPTFKKEVGAHTERVLTVAVSHDSKYLATGGCDKKIKVWDLVKGTLVFTLAKASDCIYMLAFRGETYEFVSTSRAGVIALHKATDSKLYTQLYAHDKSKPVGALSIHPNGKIMVTGSADTSLKVYDFTTKKVVKTMTDHKANILSAAFSDDGERLVSGDNNGNLFLWNTATWAVTKTFSLDKTPVGAVQFKPQSYEVLSAHNSGFLVRWKPDASAAIKKIKTHLANHIAVEAKGKRMLTTHGDNAVRIWDIDTFTPALVGRHDNIARSSTFVQYQKKTTVISGGFDWRLRAWKLLAIPPAQELPLFQDYTPQHAGPIYSVVFHKDGKKLATGGADKLIRVWEFPSGKFLYALKGHNSFVRKLRYHKDGEYLASTSNERIVYIWNVKDKDPNFSKVFSHFKPANAAGITPRFSADGSRLAFGTTAGSVILFDWKQTNKGDTLTGHDPKKAVPAIDFHPVHSHLLATASLDKTLRVWDTKKKKLVKILVDQSSDVKETDDEFIWLRFSPDGKTMAFVDRGGKIELWDTSSSDVNKWKKRRQLPLPKPDSRIYELHFHPKLNILAATVSKGLIWLWDIDTSELLQTLQSPGSGDFYSLDFKQDGKHIAVTGYDGQIRIWECE